MFKMVAVMWVFLSNGTVVTHDYPSTDDCLATQAVIEAYSVAANDKTVKKILCIPLERRNF